MDTKEKNTPVWEEYFYTEDSKQMSGRQITMRILNSWFVYKLDIFKYHMTSVISFLFSLLTNELYGSIF